MNWENLTSPDFERAVRASDGVCLLPIGCIEKHGDHLPLGQDLIYVHEICSRAAEAEPAVVFPQYYFSQIFEARHVPGTVSIRPELLLELLQSVCDEIGRNGFSRVLIVNGHGGNTNMLRYFLQLQLSQRRAYVTYLSGLDYPAPKSMAAKEATVDGHAGERETSSMLYLHPDLVQAARFGDYGSPMGRLSHLRELHLSTGIWWYADYPGHFAGERVDLSREKGEVFVEEHVEYLRKQIRATKDDTVAAELAGEFYERSEKPQNRYP